MKIQKYTKTSISILLTLLLSYGLVSAWTNLSSVTTGDNLTETIWNEMVTKLNDTGQRASGIFTDGLGRVGIGTSNPETDFVVTNNQANHTTYVKIKGTGDINSSGLSISNADSNREWQLTTRSDSNDDLWIAGYNGTSWVSAMSISQTTGNVGIGTNSPAQKLEIVGAIKSDYLVVDPQGVAGEGGEMVFMGEGSNSNIQVDNYTGNFRVFGASVVMMSIAQNGNTSIAGTLSQASDKRLKTNINNINNGLDLVSKINGVTYNWKNKNKDQRLQYGVIAQEVEKLIPELVSEDDKGIKSVNYIGFTPVLIEAVKELRKENENLKKQNEEILKRLEILESK
ncbi:MAG: tail fiber domain-containing protein [Candidatus Gracilibacteria bacterium]|nr:tail fiber domain-containing protein [Candidatus Gracilibacteria bacterium]